MVSYNLLGPERHPILGGACICFDEENPQQEECDPTGPSSSLTSYTLRSRKY